MKYKYQDKVEVVSGFFKGQVGTIENEIFSGFNFFGKRIGIYEYKIESKDFTFIESSKNLKLID